MAECDVVIRVSLDFSSVSQRTLGRIHGVHRTTIARWVARGMPRRGDGSFDVPATIRWRAGQDADAAGRLLRVLLTPAGEA